MTTTLERTVAVLACPVCGGDLVVEAGSLTCSSGHSFDIARNGTITLADHRANLTTADTAAMVADRAAFYDAGAYDAVIEAIGSAVGGLELAGDARIVDAGAGTGHLLAAILEAHPTWTGIALDTSKPAARMTARRCPRTAGVVADLWRPWPVRTSSVDVVLTMFAPRNADQVQRVLRSGGAWMVAVPSEDHLAEIRDRVTLLGIPPDKSAEIASALPDGLTVAENQQVRHVLRMTREDVATLVRMGPNRHHVTDAELEAQIEALDEVEPVTQVIDLLVMRRK